MRFAFLLACAFLASESRAEDEGAQINVLVAKVVGLADPGSGVNEAGQALAKKLSELNNTKVVEALIPLLDHRDEGVRDLAGYMVLECSEGIHPSQLELLKTAYQRGAGWLPGAIASLKNDEAARFLAEEYRKDPVIHGQLDWALTCLGERAVPHLMREFMNADPKEDNELFRGIRHVFAGMQGKAEPAIPKLLRIAQNPMKSDEIRCEAILTLGAIGPSSRVAVPQLQELAAENPDRFRDAAESAILSMGIEESADALMRFMDASPELLLLRDIAGLGSVARHVGDSVAEYLKHDDPDIRVGAARALGYIGYQEGWKKLVEAMQEKRDWRLVFCAVESLGRLKQKEALAALAGIAEEHWYPEVRKAAEKAIEVINGEENYDQRYHEDNFALEFFHYESLGFDLELSTEEVESLELPFEAKSAKRARLGNRISNVDEFRRTVGIEEPFADDPYLAVKVEDGVLLGSDRGEWGGELIFVDEDRQPTLIMRENVAAIFEGDGAFYVVGGLAHMGSNRGVVFRVKRSRSGWKVEDWLRLPGAPTVCREMSDGRYFVSTVGGAILFGPDGSIEFVDSPNDAKGR